MYFKILFASPTGLLQHAKQIAENTRGTRWDKVYHS